MLKQLMVLLMLFGYSVTLQAMPKIEVKTKVNRQGYTQIQVYNETRVTLACYVAIDGNKTRFVLPARNSSLWYQATSKQHNHTHFKTWCDYLTYHPHYEAYRTR